MANTYTQIYLHVVIAVKDRRSLIKPRFENEMYAYICGICTHRKHLVRAINGCGDHIHMLISMHPNESISELMKTVKQQTSRWIHEQHHSEFFEWQPGFGAFSYSKTLLPKVESYIANQKEHHKKVSFDEEIRNICRIAGVDFDEHFLLKGIPD